MSLSDLVSGGAGCGPSNPLQNIGKRFGQDRTTQLDSFSNVSATSPSPSTNVFRSSSSNAIQSQHGNTDFFQTHQPHHGLHLSHDRFNISQLRGNLPQVPSHMPQSMAPQLAPNMAMDLDANFRSPIAVTTTSPSAAGAAPAWAADFLKMGGTQRPSAVPQATQQQANISMPMTMPMFHRPMSAIPNMSMGGALHHASLPQHHMPMVNTASSTSHSTSQHDAMLKVDSEKWQEAFTKYDTSAPSLTPAAEQVIQQDTPSQDNYTDRGEQDELARTAGRLVSSVENNQSDKFKQSHFLDLMRRIRDKQAGIRGTEMVEDGYSAQEATSLDKGKAKAHDDVSEPISLQQPTNQQEAYRWANEMTSSGQSTQLPYNVGRNRMIPPSLPLQQEMANRQSLNDLWAQEDARSEAIERQAMEEQTRAFVGDAGNVQERMREDDAEAREFEKYQRLGANIPHASSFRRQWQEDLNPSQDQDQDEQDFVGRSWQGTKGRGVPGAQVAEWDKLQADWDNFEATSAGITPVMVNSRSEALFSPPKSAQYAPSYRFLSDNPYIALTRQHAAHSNVLPAGLESVLEKEAVVEAEPNRASAWYELGIKQQENERELQAIAALQRAIQLDPQLKDAWLALAVSYTNESDRNAAQEAIERWTEMNDKYKEVVAQHKQHEQQTASFDKTQRTSTDSYSSRGSWSSVHERHSQLTERLIAMARHGSDKGEVDADVQVALGVLFNASEDYQKAVDCFYAALSVRPSDWLLYNRLGATLSNSGRSAEAIQYYHHALNLQPEFVRCHFNLSISCLNLKLYQDAAEHIYTALTLQHAEVDTLEEMDPNRRSTVTSNSLWETFRVSLELLNRPDWASKCVTRDINQFDVNDLVAPVSSRGDVGRV